MQHKKLLALVLSVIVFCCSCVITASAEEKTRIGIITGTNVIVREEATAESKEITNETNRLSNVKVTVNSKKEGQKVDGYDTNIWYNITYNDITGYVYGAFIHIPPTIDDYVYDENFEENLKNFPESYRDSLRALHSKYPNWKFVANTFDLTFKAAVEAQYGVESVKDTRKWVEFTYGGNEWRDMRGYDEKADKWLTLESRWTYASRAAIEYFMDPRNSLNEDMIFAFMQQSYQEDEKMHENLLAVIKGTFLETGYDKDGDGKIESDADKNAYTEDIIAAAKESKVSPYVLAATILVEQGTKGETQLISGKYSGFEGYYNFFNFAASGSSSDEIAASGLAYAKENGWNSRTASIVGGAKKYADGYIDVGQDTYYYKDFNVVNKIWNHQYAAALYDAWTNAKRLKNGCINNTDATITFMIPIFTDMAEKPCPAPSTVVIPDPAPTPTLPPTDNPPPEEPTPESKPEPTPEPTPEPAPPPEPVIKKGDTNDDGQINAIDLAAVKMQILGVKNLEGNAAKAGDVNGDGAINAIDLASIKMHILKVKTIS